MTFNVAVQILVGDVNVAVQIFVGDVNVAVLEECLLHGLLNILFM